MAVKTADVISHESPKPKAEEPRNLQKKYEPAPSASINASVASPSADEVKLQKLEADVAKLEKELADMKIESVKVKSQQNHNWNTSDNLHSDEKSGTWSLASLQESSLCLSWLGST